MRFLTRGDDEQLARAALVAARQFNLRTAKVAHAEVGRDGRGAVWVYGGARPGSGNTITYPDFRGRDGGKRLDGVMGLYRRRRPVRAVDSWAPQLAVGRDLHYMLVARGFNWGGRGNAMACDLRRLRSARRVDGLTVRPSEDDTIWNDNQHPFHLGSPHDKARRDEVTLRHEAQQRWPDRVAHFVGWVDGRPAGHATVSVCTGPYGSAGIYDVGVLQDFRGRGIGAAVTRAACAHGRKLGARFAVLGASDMGFGVYKRLGFRDLGPSWYWVCSQAALKKRVSQRHIRLAEAVGRGDAEAFDRLFRREDRKYRTPSGMSLMDFAARAGRLEMVQRLLARGASPSILALWDADQPDEARRLMKQRPALMNRRYERWGATLLHEAILRKDVKLLRALLDAGADTTIKDKTFRADALGWAHHFGFKDFAKLIERQRKRR